METSQGCSGAPNSLQDAALLEAVLSVQMIATLLAIDAWCFLARYERLWVWEDL